MRGANGRVVDLEVSTSCAFPEPKWTLLGSCGTLVSDGLRSKIKWFDPKKLGKLAVIETPLPGRLYGNDDIIPWQEEEVASSGTPIGDFYDNVWDVLRNRKKMVVTPEQGVEIIRTIHRAKKGTGFK
jgi:hypothetical protein